MRRQIQGLVAGGAFALYAALGAAAFAQPMGGMPGMGGDPHGDMPPGKMMMAHADSPAEQAGRLRDLLQLHPAQEPALQSYVAALESAHKSMMDGMQMSGPMPATTPERLARMQQMMAQHQSFATAAMDATRKFYDQLDASQKRAFDAMPMMMMHDGMGMMAGGMGPMGGPSKHGLRHPHHAPRTPAR
jgi:hypothetical protein